MSFQSWYKARRAKKQLARAIEAGKTSPVDAPRVIVASGRSGSRIKTVSTPSTATGTSIQTVSRGGTTSSRGGGISTRGTPTIDVKTGKVVYIDKSKATERFTQPQRQTTRTSARQIIPTGDIRREMRKLERKKESYDLKKRDISKRNIMINSTSVKKDSIKTTEIFQQEKGIITASTYQSGQGTVSYKREITPIKDVKTQPYVIEKPTGEVFEIEKKKYQIFKTKYVDPTVIGKQFERHATKEEVKLLEEKKSALILGKTAFEKPSFKSKLFGKAKEVESFLGFDVSSEQEGFKKLETVSVAAIKKRIPGKTGEVFSGIVGGIIPTTPREVGFTALTFAAGALLGAGVKGASVAVKTVPRIGGLLSRGVKGGVAIGGTILTGAYVVDVGKQVKATPDYEEKGEIIGETAREFLVLGAGFKTGTKTFDIIKSKRLIKGRAEIPIERLVTKEVLSGKKTFPTAAIEQHFELFQKTAERFPELAEKKPGAFHTTPEIFWKKSIKLQSGKSELPGLYGSSDVSVYFAQLGGKGQSKIRLFPRLKTLFAPETKPGIAFLKPERFRVSSWSGKPRKPIIEKGERIKEFAFWDKPAEKGVADIPKMKAEIEAIFRPGSGEYRKKQAKYYTEYDKIKIPIDVFEYVPSTKKIDPVIKKSKVKIIKEGSYKLPAKESYSAIEPRSSLFLQPSYIKEDFYKPSSSKASPKISSRIDSPLSPTASHIISKISLKESYKISSRIDSPLSPTASHIISKISSKKITIPSYKTKAKKPKDIKPKIKIKPKPKPTKDIKKLKDKYDIFIKKKGKFEDVGDAGTVSEAFKLGKKHLLKDLSASLKVIDKSTGNPMSAKKYVSKMFRLSKQKKLKPHVLVQKKSGGSGRLTTVGERKAIQSATKKAPRKKNTYKPNRFRKKKGFSWI